MKQLFKYLFIFAFLATASVSASTSPFNGLYVGLGLGGTQTLAKHQDTTSANFTVTGAGEFFNLINPIFFIDPRTSRNCNDYESNFFGILNVGYGHRLGCSLFYLSAEAFADATQRDLDSIITLDNPVFAPEVTFSDLNLTYNQRLVTKINTRMNNVEYGVDLRPGILLSRCTLLYGRVGAAFNKIKLTTSNSFRNTGNFTDFDDPRTTATLDIEDEITARKNESVTGLRLGVGIEQAICNNITLKLDYVYTDYGTLDIRKVADTTGGLILLDENIAPIPSIITFTPTTTVNGFEQHTHVRLQSNTVTLGIAMYFNCI